MLVAIAHRPVAYFKGGWRGVHPGKKREGVSVRLVRGYELSRAKAFENSGIPRNLRAFINIKFNENVPGGLADPTIEFDFCYRQQHFGERKAHAEGSSCFLRRRRNGHDCSLHTDTG